MPSAPPSAEAEPLFASDEEALAAAEAAYAEYLAVSNKILENGGEGEEELRPLVSAEVFGDEAAGFGYRRENGLVSVGGTQLVETELQQVIPGGPATEVVAFFCLSYESVDVVGPDGESVVPDDRAPFATYEGAIEFTSNSNWVLKSNDFWEEGASCD